MLFFIVLLSIVLMARLGVKKITAFLILTVLNFVYIFVVLDFLIASSVSHYLIFTEDHVEAGRFLIFIISTGVSAILLAVIYPIYRLFK